MPPDPKKPHGGHGRFEKHGDCVFSKEHGARGMFLDRDFLKWKHEHFDSWLVCDSDDGEEAELKFWGTTVHGTWREEPRRCAAVKLRLME